MLKALPMKNTLLLALFALITATACHKSKLNDDNGCIQRIQTAPGFANTITAADYADITALFTQNSLNYSNLRFYNIYRGSYQSYRGTDSEISVSAYQYVNGLAVFSSDRAFNFTTFDPPFVSGPEVASVPLDTVATMKLPHLRAIFMTISNAARYKDSCLIAEFGYFDLNRGSSGTAPRIIKCWRVSSPNTLFPYAIIADDGPIIDYQNGIVIF
jgi:hypothetical protein